MEARELKKVRFEDVREGEGERDGGVMVGVGWMEGWEGMWVGGLDWVLGLGVVWICVA